MTRARSTTTPATARDRTARTQALVVAFAAAGFACGDGAAREPHAAPEPVMPGTAAAPPRPAPSRPAPSGDVVWLDDEALRARSSWVTPRVPGALGQATRPLRATRAASRRVFLNRCAEGCVITAGPDDAARDVSSIAPRTTRFEPFPWGDARWDAVVQCVRRQFAPFDVDVDDEDPGSSPHVENVVTGDPRMLDLDNDIGGVSPGACEPLSNVISYTFAQRYVDGNLGGLCTTITHELGHTFGLDHAYLCSDVMTYLDACGEQTLRNVDARCGERTGRTCLCRTPEYQNSAQYLRGALGDGADLDRRPEVTIVAPESGDTVSPPYVVFVDARDDRGVTALRLFGDGVELATSTVVPARFVLEAPVDRLEARAYDDAGQWSRYRIRLTVAPRPARTDAQAFDAVAADAVAVLGLRVDAGAEDVDAGLGEVGAGEGCRCVGARDAQLAPALVGSLFLVGLLFGRRARRAVEAAHGRRRIAGAAAAAIAASSVGCDETSLVSARVALRFDPAPGAPLSLGVRTFGRLEVARAEVLVANVGDAVATLDARADGPEAALLSVLEVPRILLPGEAGRLVVQLDVPYAATLGAELAATTNARELPTPRWPLEGGVRAPCQLVVDPVVTRADLGRGTPLALRAAGLSPCTVTRVLLDPSVFALGGLPPTPFTIDAGASLPFTVTALQRGQLGDRPRRTLYVLEAEGGGAEASIQGPSTAWDCLIVSPTSVRLLQPVTRGEQVDVPVTLVNLCTQDSVELTSVVVGRGWEHFSVPTRPPTPRVFPGESVSLAVRFAPETDGPVPGELVVRTDDAARQPWIKIPIEATGKVPRVFVPPRHALAGAPRSGSGATCASRVSRVPVVALGPGRAFVRSVTLSGRDADQIAILGFEREDGRQLALGDRLALDEGETGAVLLELRPRRVGPVEATLTITHTGRGDVSRVALGGLVVDEAPRVDRFEGGRAPKLDLVFVIDDSQSMVSSRSRLAAATARVAARLSAVDAHVVVTTANATEVPFGVPRGSPPLWRTRALGASSFAPWLDRALWVDRGSVAVPAHLAAFLALVDRVELPSDPFDERPLEGAFRPDARLVVIPLTDDDDDGPTSRVSPLGFARTLRALAGEPSLGARLSPLVASNPATCTGPGSRRGARLQAVARDTGGAVAELCAPSLETSLDALLDDALAPPDTFALSAEPRAGTLAVRVDGVLLAEDTTTPGRPALGWRLDRATRRVTVAPSPVGAVAITYTPTCQPE
jgi:hypothetical protein